MTTIIKSPGMLSVPEFVKEDKKPNFSKLTLQDFEILGRYYHQNE
jgi:hypothetical protein